MPTPFGGDVIVIVPVDEVQVGCIKVVTGVVGVVLTATALIIFTLVIQSFPTLTVTLPPDVPDVTVAEIVP